MLISEPGHCYYLDERHSAQPIHFRRKVCPREQPEMHLLSEIQGGTTCAEVLEVLLHRLAYLQEDACRPELKRAQQLLEQAHEALTRQGPIISTRVEWQVPGTAPAETYSTALTQTAR